MFRIGIKVVLLLLLPFVKSDCNLGDLNNIEPVYSGFDINTTIVALSNIDANRIDFASSDPVLIHDFKDGVLKIMFHDTSEFERRIISDGLIKSITANISTDCQDTQKKITVFMQDTNNHDPSFVEDENGTPTETYELILPMPFPAGTSMNDLGGQLFAKDIDFTNTKIEFTIDSDDLEIVYDKKVDVLQKIHRATIRSKKSLSYNRKVYTVTATDSGTPTRNVTATLIISKNEDTSVNMPYFDEPFYIGSYNMKTNEFTPPAIKLLDNNNNNIPLIIKEEYSKNFKASFNNNNNDIVITKEMDLEDIEDSYIAFTITADTDISPRTVVIVDILGNLQTTTDSTSISTITTSGTSGTSTTVIDTTTTASDTTTTGNDTTTTATSDTTTTISDTTTTSSGTSATASDTTTTASDSTTTGNDTSTTATSDITTTTSDTTTTTIDTTMTASDPTTGTTDTTMTSDSSDPTGTSDTTTSTSDTTTTTTSDTTITASDLTTGTSFTTATSSNDLTTGTSGTTMTASDTTTVCEITTTTSETTETPTTVTFDEHPREKRIGPEDMKSIVTFHAKSSRSHDKITYVIKNAQTPNSLFLNSNTGELTAESHVPSGVYDLKIEATASPSTAKATTDFKLVVDSTQSNCGDVRTHYAYLIKNVTEKCTEDTIVLAAPTDDNYEFNIFSQYPKTESTKLFSVNEAGDLVCHYLDREASYFSEMTTPQFTVTVRLQKKKPKTSNIYALRTYSSQMEPAIVPYNLIMPETIENLAGQTVVSILIEDINDHKPEFEEDTITVYYPSNEIVHLIRPPYLTKVHARDLDDPTAPHRYGEITYSTESSAVTVDAHNGIVYPTEKFYIFTNDDEVTIKATDGGDRFGIQTIKVKLLDEDHIGVLILRDIALDKIPAELAKISTDAGITMKYLSASVMPPRGSPKNSRSVQKYLTQIYVYGLLNETPLKQSVLQQKLETIDKLELKSFDSHQSSPGDCKTDEEEEPVEDTTGLIVAVCVLTVLLVLFIIGGGTFWYFKLRTKPISHEEMDNNKSRRPSKDNSLNARQPKEKRRSTDYVPAFNPPPPEETEGFHITPPSRSPTVEKLEADERREREAAEAAQALEAAKAAEAARAAEAEHSQPRSSQELTPEQQRNLDRRKSVSFSENILEYNITKTDDDEDEDNPPSILEK